MTPIADAVGDADALGDGEGVGFAVGVDVILTLAVGGEAGALLELEHAACARTRNRRSDRIVRIDGAFSKATGMRGFDRVSGEIAASRGRRFTLVNQDGSQTTGDSYALAA